ncbi:hypothetical protein [Weissella koreensis]|uniref:hypothetical protein n=1 Tax=Weissella koreensis TaxID=165096 RepID=UPI001FAA6B40|nr:hypothetical protein [Weissella koreensis]
MIFSYSFLNFIANVCVFLPYFITLMAYANNHNPLLLVTLAFIYATRSVSIMLFNIFSNKWNNILISIAAGILGALSMAMIPLNIYSSLLAGILLVYHSATLWPTFFAGKVDLDYTSKINQKYIWSIFILLIVMLVAILLAHPYSESYYQINFLGYGILSMLCLPSAYKMTKDLAKQDVQKISDNNPILFLALVFIIFTIRGVLFLLSKGLSKNYGLDLLISIILIILIVYVISVSKKFSRNIVFNLTILRGMLMVYVLFFATFYSMNWFGSKAPIIMYILYLIGFESGSIVVKKVNVKPDLLLYFGALMISIPNQYSYLLGILLWTLYLGYLNVYLNKNHVKGEFFNGGSGIIRKYQISSYGSQIGYSIIFITLLSFAMLKMIDLHNFFISNNDTIKFNLYLLNQIIVLIYLVIKAMLDIFNNDKKA